MPCHAKYPASRTLDLKGKQNYGAKEISAKQKCMSEKAPYYILKETRNPEQR